MPASSDPTKRKRQLANLRPPIAPGEVLNPEGINGRPISAAILRRATPENVDKLSEVSWRLALKGTPWFVQFVTERSEGKVADKQELSGPGGAPLPGGLDGLTADELRELLVIARRSQGDSGPA